MEYHQITINELKYKLETALSYIETEKNYNKLIRWNALCNYYKMEINELKNPSNIIKIAKNKKKVQFNNIETQWLIPQINYRNNDKVKYTYLYRKQKELKIKIIVQNVLFTYLEQFIQTCNSYNIGIDPFTGIITSLNEFKKYWDICEQNSENLEYIIRKQISYNIRYRTSILENMEDKIKKITNGSLDNKYDKCFIEAEQREAESNRKLLKYINSKINIYINNNENELENNMINYANVQQIIDAEKNKDKINNMEIIEISV